jgi:hypothetical protein
VIFRPELARKIKEGKKTQTRRVVKGECRYKPGRSYALQTGRGKKASERITVMEVRQEKLEEITLRDARREGFRTTADFKDYWTDLHGSFEPEQLVHVISFELGDHTDTPRLLAARPGAPHGDYVSVAALALRGSAEEPSSLWQRKWSSEARIAESEASRHLWDEKRQKALDAIAAIAEFAETPEQLRSFKAAERTIRTAVRKIDDAA